MFNKKEKKNQNQDQESKTNKSNPKELAKHIG